ncbi:hypothetical protein Tco_0411190 [Tanacetum coccineum]
MDVRLSMCAIRRLLNTKKASNANYFLILFNLDPSGSLVLKGKVCGVIQTLLIAMKKDTLEKVTEANLNLKLFPTKTDLRAPGFQEITKDIWFISGLGSDNDAGQAAIWHILYMKLSSSADQWHLTVQIYSF